MQSLAGGVEGIDVSRWQSPPVPAPHARFAYIKASQGTGRDRHLRGHHEAFGRQGIDRGAYCYYDFGSSPESNAATFIDATKGLTWELPHALDAEDGTGKSKAVVADLLLRFLNIVQRDTGRVPVVYTGTYWWKDHVGSDQRFARFPLWLARYPNRDAVTPPQSWGNTKPPAPWTEIAIWQYSDSGGRLDRNVSPAALYASLRAGGSTAKPDPQPKPQPEGELTVADIQDIIDRLDRIERGQILDEQSDDREAADEKDRDGSTRGYLFALAEALGHSKESLEARAKAYDKADTFKQK